MQEETSRASLSMMIPRDQTVSSWYTCHFLTLYTVGRILLMLDPARLTSRGFGRPDRGLGWSEAGWEREGLRRDDPADVELDDRVRGELDRARVAGEPPAVEEHRHVPGGVADLGAAQRPAPDVEELPEGVDALGRGLDVDDPGGVVGVQPVQALAAFDEAVHHLLRPGDPDPGRDHLAGAGDVDRQVSVDVVGGLLAGLAPDAVDHGTAGRAWAFLRRRAPTGEGDHRHHHERDGRQHGRAGQDPYPGLPCALLPPDLGQLLLRATRPL